MELNRAVRGDVFLCLFALLQKKLCSDPRDLHRIDDDALRNAEYLRRWPPGDDPLAREAGAQRCAPACGLVRMLTHAERLAGPEANQGGGQGGLGRGAAPQ